MRDPALVKQAVRAHPGRVAVGLDARDGKVAVEGWAETSNLSALNIAKRFEDAGVASDRVAPVNPLGYGVAVLYGVGDYRLGSKLAADLKAATAGRLVPDLQTSIYVNDGELAIAIGKRPRR